MGGYWHSRWLTAVRDCDCAWAVADERARGIAALRRALSTTRRALDAERQARITAERRIAALETAIRRAA